MHPEAASFLDAGSMCPPPMCPRPKVLGCCAPCMICPFGKLRDVWPVSPTPLTDSIGLCPSVRCKLGPNNITPSYCFAPLGDTPWSFSSKYLGMGWFGQEHKIQGTLCPRGATSKNGCGMAHLVACRLAVRRARVRIPTRHPWVVSATELISDEGMERSLGECSWM
jgi:hypothetical protein